jgi:hypothetical protein
MNWQILDTADLRRNRARREGERRIEWRVSLRNRMKFRALLHERIELESWPQTPEIQLRMQLLEEEIRSLPGFPRRFDPDRDLIIPVTTSVSR